MPENWFDADLLLLGVSRTGDWSPPEVIVIRSRTMIASRRNRSDFASSEEPQRTARSLVRAPAKKKHHRLCSRALHRMCPPHLVPILCAGAPTWSRFCARAAAESEVAPRDRPKISEIPKFSARPSEVFSSHREV